MQKLPDTIANNNYCIRIMYNIIKLNPIHLFLFKQIYVKNIFANNDTFKRLEITIGCTRTLAPDERMYWKYDRRIVSL